MQRNIKLAAVLNSACVLASLGVALSAREAAALPIGLGTAGPGNWGVLEIGNGNVSLANAANSGFISGNVGVNGSGNLSDGGNFPIPGNVYLGPSATSTGLTGNVSGSIFQNSVSQAMLAQATTDALNAFSAASALSASGGGLGVTSINTGQTLSPGVYFLSSLSLNNGAKLILSGTAADSYVFNISGALSLNSAQILVSGGLSDANVLFNITGSQAVQFSGGLSDSHGEAELDGIILAPNAAVQVTPGAVKGEIISGKNINIASGGSVQGVPPSAPDAGSSLLLLSLGMGSLLAAMRRLTVQH